MKWRMKNGMENEEWNGEWHGQQEQGMAGHGMAW